MSSSWEPNAVPVKRKLSDEGKTRGDDSKRRKHDRKDSHSKFCESVSMVIDTISRRQMYDYSVETAKKAKLRLSIGLRRDIDWFLSNIRLEY